MLVVLYGLPCTGKSTIMEKLVSGYDFIYINCYITRKPRYDDKARIPLTMEEYFKMKEDGKFIFSNEHYSGNYGTPREEIEKAISDRQNFYVIDYLIQNQNDFKDIPHKKILIIPDTIESLTLWILGSTRIERLNKIIEEYKTYYTSENIVQYKSDGFECIINSFGLLDDVVDEIVRITEAVKIA